MYLKTQRLDAGSKKKGVNGKAQGEGEHLFGVSFSTTGRARANYLNKTKGARGRSPN
jgi:hypothetical protein